MFKLLFQRAFTLSHRVIEASPGPVEGEETREILVNLDQQDQW